MSFHETNGGPAFPQTTVENGKGDFPWDGYGRGGMSLRDYFAGQALAGMHAADTSDSCMSNKKKAERAYESADAMLAARAPKPEATA